MKISYDAEVDALSIMFRETTVTTKHLAEGIAADYDHDGRLAGLEILDAQKRFGGREPMREVDWKAWNPPARRWFCTINRPGNRKMIPFAAGLRCGCRWVLLQRKNLHQAGFFG